MQKRFRTFGERALDFVKNQISCFQFTSVVVDIFDRYGIQNSVKKAERDRRSKSVSLHLIEGRVIPDWKKFISSGENIIRFLGDYINCQTYSSEQFSPRRAITLTGRFIF